MSKKEKLIRRLKSKPKDFTYDEADLLLTSLGMRKSNKGRTSGSRVEFSIGDFKIRLHKPHPHKELKKYQISDLLDDLTDGGLI
ncbi:MAG: type II toxin-antitoxin system HicA family toxin [Defluviitaleaceae bacterium]|nr:type II toxin-antitoxin system HicA family toxin [Defluviitaleaceae bacterium]